MLVKPLKEDDTRNNDDIKAAIKEKLKCLRNRLKIRDMKQMRNKGIIIEVNDDKDCNLIKGSKLEEVGLKTQEPTKLNPTVIIYDVERDLQVDEMKDELIGKNLNHFDNEYISEIKDEIKFLRSYKTKEDKSNWILQIPGRLHESLVDRGRIFMSWRTYRVKEYLNLTRCYRCYGFGHTAKMCKHTDQLCETCGDTKHLKNECPKNDDPQCSNCLRNRRKDIKHSVRSKLCPEYIKFSDIYRSRIKWD